MIAQLFQLHRFFCVDLGTSRACGAAGSAPAWHAGGQGFESPQVHRGFDRLNLAAGIFSCNLVVVLSADLRT